MFKKRYESQMSNRGYGYMRINLLNATQIHRYIHRFIDVVSLQVSSTTSVYFESSLTLNYWISDFCYLNLNTYMTLIQFMCVCQCTTCIVDIWMYQCYRDRIYQLLQNRMLRFCQDRIFLGPQLKIIIYFNNIILYFGTLEIV